MTESAELRKPKRVRHLFPRQEVYHRFIHSAEYAYSPNGRKQISCVGNYIMTGSACKYSSVEYIESMWEYNKQRMIGIIDRENKVILINESHEYVWWDLEKAVPDDYTIYKTTYDIPNKDVLKDKEACFRIHTKYLIEYLAKTFLRPYYRVIYGNALTINSNIRTDWNHINYYGYNNIIKFIKENNIKKYSLYNECFNENYKVTYYTGWTKRGEATIKLPTLKQIVTNTVFTKKQKLLLEQRYFWTKYCNGNGISFKDVVDNWNKEVTFDEAIAYFNKHFYVNDGWFNEKQHTWNDYVAKAIEGVLNVRLKYLKECRDKSDQNYHKAIDELNKISNIYDWRNSNNYARTITYRKFFEPRTKNGSGTWKDVTITSAHTFPNTQLKLTNAGQTIVTSRRATVPLSEGIKMYKMFKLATTKYPKRLTFTKDDFGETIIGIYNLRFVTYKDKVTDAGKNLNYKEWCIQIGCHSLWLDDVMEFIHYYKLEDKFGITK